MAGAGDLATSSEPVWSAIRVYASSTSHCNLPAKQPAFEQTCGRRRLRGGGGSRAALGWASGTIMLTRDCDRRRQLSRRRPSWHRPSPPRMRHFISAFRNIGILGRKPQ
eukprot:scaffold11169_cov72-Phaeocystis_antarctica.AAC.2